MNRLKPIFLPLLVALVALSSVLFLLQWQGQAMAASDANGPPLPIEIETDLWYQVSQGESQGFLIYFRERPDLSLAFHMDWVPRGRFVAMALQQAAQDSQARVRNYLDAQGLAYRSFWIDNLIVVEGGATVNTLEELTRFSEIAALRSRRKPVLHAMVDLSPVQNAPTGVTSNTAHVKADQVWAMGYRGEGIVVANIDTGVRYTHEALVNRYRGNLGNGLFDHNFNWWDPLYGGSDPEPDPNYSNYAGHGTNTMGIMVGDENGRYQTGMAPRAQWIACQAFEVSDIELLECAQFMAAPWDLNGENANPDYRPHIVNNSWGDCEQSLDPWFKGVVESWLAAGIYPVFSNGNSSNCGYSSPPGLNTVGNPARYGNVTGVGSTGTDDGEYATHSNWGPTDDPDTINPLGFPDLKPQVLAPGVFIITTSGAGDTNYAASTGTSASAPHVAGLVALLWDAAPCLIGNYTATETIIQQTATPILYDDGTGGGARSPNYATGWGEIDALAAVQRAMASCSNGFQLSAKPLAQAVCQPEDSLYSVRVDPVLSFTDVVTLSVDGLPAGVTSVFSDNPVIPPATTSLTLQVTSAADPGSYDLEIRGESLTQTATTTLRLDIYAQVPGAPTLTRPENGAEEVAETPTLAWNSTSGAAGFLVEIATDSLFEALVYSATTSLAQHEVRLWLDHEAQYYWRVRGLNACGNGPPSETSEFRVKAARSVLLVDDDDDWPDVQGYYTEALTGLGFGYDVWSTTGSDLEPGEDLLADYDVVIWFTGGAQRSYTGPSPETESALASWANLGRCFLISSQDYYYARGLTDLMTATLGVAAVVEYAQPTVVTGTGSIFGSLGPYTLTYPFPNRGDSITPTVAAAQAFSSDAGVVAISLGEGANLRSYWGFPLEAIESRAARMEALEAFLRQCGFVRVFMPILAR